MADAPDSEIMIPETKISEADSLFDLLLALEEQRGNSPAIGQLGPATAENVRLRPSPNLSFPERDIESVVPASGMPQRQVVTTTFFGLVGGDSPLPFAYADRVAELTGDHTGDRIRGFLDIFHHRLLSFLFRGWMKHRVAKPTHPDRLWLRLAGSVGSVQRAKELRLLIWGTRTAEGCAAFLESALGRSVRVKQLVRRWVTVVPAARSRLGSRHHQLGSSLWMGRKMSDVNRLNITTAARSFEDYRALVKGGPDHARMVDALGRYFATPADISWKIRLAGSTVEPWRLGKEYRLGRHVWLGKPRGAVVSAQFHHAG